MNIYPVHYKIIRRVSYTVKCAIWNMCIRFFFGKINLRQFVFFRCNNNIHRRVVGGSSSGRPVVSIRIIGLSNIILSEGMYRMKYRITNYTRKMANKIGVVVKPSSDPLKKIDVYRNSRKIASVGAAGMNDFPTYIRTRGMVYAKTRRRLYKMRHERDRHRKWSNGWLADKLLW